MQSAMRKSFLGAACGSMLEYYDYALFSTFLPLIAPLFFPAQSAYASLQKGFSFLLIAMIFRPIGALFFGYVGDKVGRRGALLTSMYGIALATLAIGLTPSYAMIGPTAMVLILVAKTVQVFCFGGEFNGGGVYAIELMQQRREGLGSGIFTAITLSGSLIASLYGILLTAKDMPAWGWRSAFIIGGLIGLLAIR